MTKNIIDIVLMMMLVAMTVVMAKLGNKEAESAIRARDAAVCADGTVVFIDKEKLNGKKN